MTAKDCLANATQRQCCYLTQSDQKRLNIITIKNSIFDIVCEFPLSLVLNLSVAYRNIVSNVLLLVIVSRYPDMEQTVSQRDSSTPQKSSLCHHHYKQVRELLYLSSNFLNIVL